MNVTRLAAIVLGISMASFSGACREPTRQIGQPSFNHLLPPEASSHITRLNPGGWPPQLRLEASSYGEQWGASNVRSKMFWGPVSTCEDVVPQRRFESELDGSYNQDPGPDALPTSSAVSVDAPVAEVSGTKVRAYIQTLHTFFEHSPYIPDQETATANTADTVCVDAPHVTTVTVTPPSATINVGLTKSFAATPRDQDGFVMTGKTAAWSSSAASVATINTSGIATGVSGGQATITATVDGVPGTATLTVNVLLPTPTNCTIQYIPGPNYLKVTWVNADPAASTEVQINRNGIWNSPATQSPGLTQYFYTLGSQTGQFYARVRHVRSGFYAPSAYCNTGSITR